MRISYDSQEYTASLKIIGEVGGCPLQPPNDISLTFYHGNSFKDKGKRQMGHAPSFVQGYEVFQIVICVELSNSHTQVRDLALCFVNNKNYDNLIIFKFL